MTTDRPTCEYLLSRRAARQCLGLGAVATARPASAATVAVETATEKNDTSADALPPWLTFPEQQWQRITPAEAGIDPAAFEKLLAESQIGPKGWGGTRPNDTQWGGRPYPRRIPGAGLGGPTFKTQSVSLGKCITRALIHVVAGDPRTLVSIAKTNTGGFPFGADVNTTGNFACPAHLIAGSVARQ